MPQIREWLCWSRLAHHAGSFQPDILHPYHPNIQNGVPHVLVSLDALSVPAFR